MTNDADQALTETRAADTDAAHWSTVEEFDVLVRARLTVTTRANPRSLSSVMVTSSPVGLLDLVARDPDEAVRVWLE